MDARITKQRLANMLAYDWLKILGVIILAAIFFGMFFTMIGTHPTDGQSFYVYAYNGLTAGGDFGVLKETMTRKNVFGYDILDIGSEVFSSGGIYGSTVFNSRRAAGEGRVMFVNDVRTKDEEGNESSTLLGFLDYEGTEMEGFYFFLDPQEFLQDCKTYLETFFGEGLTGELNEEQARAAFLARNGKDARFRTSSKKKKGILWEGQRLEKLKEDYLLVSSEIGQSLGYVTYTTEIKEHVVGFSMTSLNLTSLIYYVGENEEGEKVQKNSDIALCIFDNGEREGDLKYETVNFLAYLVRNYGPKEPSEA